MTHPKQRPSRPATDDDVLAAPEHLTAEIIGGELLTSPRPESRVDHELPSDPLPFLPRGHRQISSRASRNRRARISAPS